MIKDTRENVGYSHYHLSDQKYKTLTDDKIHKKNCVTENFYKKIEPLLDNFNQQCTNK